jgi:hypothetical protein
MSDENIPGTSCGWKGTGRAGATPYLGRTFTGWISPASWRTSGTV